MEQLRDLVFGAPRNGDGVAIILAVHSVSRNHSEQFGSAKVMAARREHGCREGSNL